MSVACRVVAPAHQALRISFANAQTLTLACPSPFSGERGELAQVTTHRASKRGGTGLQTWPGSSTAARQARAGSGKEGGGLMQTLDDAGLESQTFADIIRGGQRQDGRGK